MTFTRIEYIDTHTICAMTDIQMYPIVNNHLDTDVSIIMVICQFADNLPADSAVNGMKCDDNKLITIDVR